MTELVEGGLNDQLVEPAPAPPAEGFVQRCDMLFFKAFEHFRLLNALQSLYSFGKVLACLVIFVLEVWVWEFPCGPQAIWCLLLAPVSLLQFVAYRLMAKATNRLENFMFLAEALEHV